MSNYILNYKGSYRILAELDSSTNDFPRDSDGIDPDIGLYIPCKYNGKIYAWGLNESRRAVLQAYVASLTRGRNIKKAMIKDSINFFDYDESSSEVMFKFMPADIDAVAEMMGAKTGGAGISPFSKRNLPKNKEAAIPLEKIEEYKRIISKVNKDDLLIIHRITNAFLSDILEKSLRKKGARKPFDWTADSKQMKLSRDIKAYIHVKGLWQEYLCYLDKKICEFYEDDKQHLPS